MPNTTDKDDKPVTIYLTRAAHTPIPLNVKVKANPSPYDSEWEAYFEKRLDTRMGEKLWSKQQLLSLWRSQRGFCPICQ
ncbi:MAG: hypothetical protein WAM60_13625 [Candidatus Promineifilaceae bacterium]